MIIRTNPHNHYIEINSFMIKKNEFWIWLKDNKQIFGEPDHKIIPEAVTVFDGENFYKNFVYRKETGMLTEL